MLFLVEPRGDPSARQPRCAKLGGVRRIGVVAAVLCALLAAPPLDAAEELSVEATRRGAPAPGLDALVWRVTLARDGEPLIHDSMQACGCYHEFFPTPRARLRPAPEGLEEWAFVPQTLPRVREGERALLRIASATHYIEGVSLVRGTDSLAPYAMRGYDELRSLRDFADGQRSAFGPDGLIEGTERRERFLFWPMGIASAGAMRQWGRHATAFVGRRHFDDADLQERRFELELREPRQ